LGNLANSFPLPGWPLTQPANSNIAAAYKKICFMLFFIIMNKYTLLNFGRMVMGW